MAKQVALSWKKRFVEIGLRPELVETYSAYVSTLVENDTPVIFDLEHLASLLGRKPSYLASVINSSESHYREFQIPKRRGGKRTINAPYPALMECQHWIYRNILLGMKIHPTAHGFAPRKSILTNARIHLQQQHFLKIDLKDFFPSIRINRVIAIFRSLGYTPKVSFFLAAICCHDSRLAQGAPTSPYISNIVARPLDSRLLALAKHFGLKYTRYADDIAFSGAKINLAISRYVSSVITDEGFEVNDSKTHLQRHKGRRILTGISIAGETLQLPRKYKRDLKQEIHFVRKFGLLSHVLKRKIRVSDYLGSLKGKIQFWLAVEPRNAFALRAWNDLDGYASEMVDKM